MLWCLSAGVCSNIVGKTTFSAIFDAKFGFDGVALLSKLFSQLKRIHLTTFMASFENVSRKNVESWPVRILVKTIYNNVWTQILYEKNNVIHYTIFSHPDTNYSLFPAVYRTPFNAS